MVPCWMHPRTGPSSPFDLLVSCTLCCSKLATIKASSWFGQTTLSCRAQCGAGTSDVRPQLAGSRFASFVFLVSLWLVATTNHSGISDLTMRNTDAHEIGSISLRFFSFLLPSEGARVAWACFRLSLGESAHSFAAHRLSPFNLAVRQLGACS